MNYLNSLTINSSKTTEYIKYDNIQKLLKSNKSNKSNQSNQLIFDKFIYVLKDYEEFLLNIKNTKKIQENISKFNIEGQEIELFKYAKLLEIVEPKKMKII